MSALCAGEMAALVCRAYNPVTKLRFMCWYDMNPVLAFCPQGHVTTAVSIPAVYSLLWLCVSLCQECDELLLTSFVRELKAAHYTMLTLPLWGSDLNWNRNKRSAHRGSIAVLLSHTVRGWFHTLVSQTRLRGENGKWKERRNRLLKGKLVKGESNKVLP